MVRDAAEVNCAQDKGEEEDHEARVRAQRDVGCERLADDRSDRLGEELSAQVSARARRLPGVAVLAHAVSRGAAGSMPAVPVSGDLSALVGCRLINSAGQAES